jgi:hypothetical protein
MVTNAFIGFRFNREFGVVVGDEGPEHGVGLLRTGNAVEREPHRQSVLQSAPQTLYTAFSLRRMGGNEPYAQLVGYSPELVYPRRCHFPSLFLEVTLSLVIHTHTPNSLKNT